MYISRIFSIILCWFLLSQSYADIPAEVLRTCMDDEPRNKSIKLMQLDVEGMATKNEPNCEDQYNRRFEGNIYGKVTCNNIHYLIVNNKKIELKSAINRSVSRSIAPGDDFTYRSFWYKIDQGSQSFLCVKSPMADSGVWDSVYQYYIVENAFDPKASPVLYYYFFGKK